MLDMYPMPEGLELLAAGQYRYTEPAGMPNEAPFVEFVVHPTDGTVEVSTADAPMVPWEVLVFIAHRARGRKYAATG